MPANGTQTVDSPLIDFMQVGQPLRKNGRLNGDFILKVRTKEVVYEDGSNWVSGETVAHAKAGLFNPHTPGGVRE